MDSDDYTTDEGKRKRNPENKEAELFCRSKKTMRTPDKAGKGEDKLERIMDMIKGLVTEVKELRREQGEFRNVLVELKKENEKIKEQNKEMETQIKILNDRIEKMENEKRRNNVIMQGLAIDTNNQGLLKEVVRNIMKKHLEIDVKIKSARKLGQKTCLIELENVEEKIKVMINKNKLRLLKEDKIYMNDDLSKKDREIQEKIRKRANMEKRNGKNVKIGFRKIFVDGMEWRWNLEKEELEITDRQRNTQGIDTKN